MTLAEMRLVLADDNYLVREGTAALLREIDEVDLVATVDRPESLLEAVDAHRPDAVLTDIRMPPTQTREGIDAAKEIRRSYPGTAVLLLSQHVEGAYIRELLDEGMSGFGYLLKERVEDVQQLVQALRSVCQGGIVLDPEVVGKMVSVQRRAEQSPVSRLTERELEVLTALAQGSTNAAISAALYLSERTVERHINAIFSKLGLAEETTVHRRVKATLTYLEHAAAP